MGNRSSLYPARYSKSAGTCYQQEEEEVAEEHLPHQYLINDVIMSHLFFFFFCFQTIDRVSPSRSTHAALISSAGHIAVAIVRTTETTVLISAEALSAVLNSSIPKQKKKKFKKKVSFPFSFPFLLPLFLFPSLPPPSLLPFLPFSLLSPSLLFLLFQQEVLICEYLMRTGSPYPRNVDDSY